MTRKIYFFPGCVPFFQSKTLNFESFVRLHFLVIWLGNFASNYLVYIQNNFNFQSC